MASYKVDPRQGRTVATLETERGERLVRADELGLETEIYYKNVRNDRAAPILSGWFDPWPRTLQSDPGKFDPEVHRSVG